MSREKTLAGLTSLNSDCLRCKNLHRLGNHCMFASRPIATSSTRCSVSVRFQTATRSISPAGRSRQVGLWVDMVNLPLVKTLVGTLLSVNFCVPLATVVSNRHLWEEPMAVLAGNMSLTTTLLGISAFLTGIYDLTDFQSIAPCRFLMYTGSGVAVAFKMAQVGAAVDQLVAVVYPLHHYDIMMQAQPWLLAATWLTCAAQILFGFVAHMLDMETFSENAANQGNNTAFTGCRWETGMANVYVIFAELEMVTFSLVTASILIYTGVVGYRVKARLVKEERQRYQDGITAGDSDNQSFFDNFRAFKYIMTVLSLTVSLDIVSPILRISSRWYPQPKLNGVLHQVRIFGFIFEGWAYGLLNAKLRVAYKKTFCRRCRRTESPVMEQNPPPNRKTTAPPAAAVRPPGTALRRQCRGRGPLLAGVVAGAASAPVLPPAEVRGDTAVCRRHRFHGGSLGESPTISPRPH